MSFSQKLQIVSDKTLFTPAKVVAELQENDESYEFTGYVVEISAPKTKNNSKNGKSSTRFIFMMCNGDDEFTKDGVGERLQFIAWGKLAEKYSTEITKIGQVVSFERLLVKANTHVSTQRKFEIVIQECTKVETLGLYNMFQDEMKSEISVASIKELRSYVDRIVEVHGYLSMAFCPVPNQNFFVGVMTDGTHKLNLTVSKTADITTQMFLGMPLTVTGKVKIPHDKPIHLSSNSVENIVFKDEDEENYQIMSIDMILDGYKEIP